MITVIAPHARPEFRANLLFNFARQRGVEARLLVVANGKALGFAEHGVLAIESAPHQAHAMNAGLAWLREHGGGPWARIDDDDYYGPDYLAETQAQLQCADVVGKRWGFVMFDDGLWRFESEGHFTGGTLAAASADVCPFLEVPDDDRAWCLAMRARGAVLAAGEPWGYCYDRRTRSAPRVIPGGPIITRWAFGAGHYYGTLPREAVDDRALRPLRAVPRPSDAEVMACL